MQSLDEKFIRINELENENRKLQAKVEMLEHNVELLTQAVLHASKQRFGASSEKTHPIEGQCFLFGEIIDEITDETKVINIKKG
jgi:transposase